MKEALARAKDCGAVIKWALITRTSFLLLQALSHNLIPDHGGSMEDVFMKTYRDPPHDVVTETTFGGLDNWDSEYFIFIAQHGYRKIEQTMAFFPLYPLLMHALSNTLFYPLTLFMHYRSVVLISGVTVNFVTFPLAAVTLYLLTHELTRDRRLSFLASALFCINPASVFMTAVYSESLFVLFTFLGLLFLEKSYGWSAAVSFAMAAATRSNGILLCGFLAFKWLLNLSDAYKRSESIYRYLAFVVQTFMVCVLQCATVLLPFAAYQYYAYTLYCPASFANSLSHPPPVQWCDWDSILPPLHYSHVQSYYWNVGFLRYFQLKQIPNFLLATPMILLAVFCLTKFVAAVRSTLDKEKKKESSVWLRREKIIPYMVHLGFLLLTGVFFMHVQVITRFMCSSTPVIYWISAETILHSLTRLQSAGVLEPKLYSFSEMSQRIVRIVLCSDSNHGDSNLKVSKLILGYFILFAFVGYILHCNFYPWT